MDSVLLFLSRLTTRSHSTPVADARESLDYWSRRVDELPWRRRAARREARERATAARAQLIGAHLERTRLGALAPRVTPLLVMRRSAPALAFASLRRTAWGRKLLLGAAALGLGTLAMVGAAAVLVMHVLPM